MIIHSTDSFKTLIHSVADVVSSVMFLKMNVSALCCDLSAGSIFIGGAIIDQMTAHAVYKSELFI